MNEETLRTIIAWCIVVLTPLVVLALSLNEQGES